MKTILKKAKRTLSLGIALIMLANLFLTMPASIFAEGDEYPVENVHIADIESNDNDLKTIDSDSSDGVGAVFSDLAETDAKSENEELDVILSKWHPLAAKYSVSTDKIIAPGDVIKTDGFEFKANGEGGIDMLIPGSIEFGGDHPIAALSSKNCFALEDLNVKISLGKNNNFEASSDRSHDGSSISILWSEFEISEIANLEENTGIVYGTQVFFNGLRNLIPDGARGLCIHIRNSGRGEPKTASDVKITLFDGNFRDTSSDPGYQWAFFDNGSSNNTLCPIDLSAGLDITVRADDTLGYVVVINGKEYYKGSDISATSDDGDGSMANAKNDIDLSLLKDVAEGYIVIGMSSNYSPDTKAFSLDSINGSPAAYVHSENHNDFERIVTKQPSCSEDGEVTVNCNSCSYTVTHAISATGEHTYGEWVVITESTCICEGKMAAVCVTCGNEITQIIPVSENHTLSYGDVMQDPDCYNPGSRMLVCLDCGYYEEETIPELEHDYTEWTITRVPDCYSSGEEVRYCNRCGNCDTKVIPSTGHSFGEWYVNLYPTCGTDGSECRECNNCGIAEYNTIPANGEHRWGKWITVNAPTSTQEGEKVRECINCDASENKKIDMLPDENEPQIIVSSVECYAGDSVTVTVYLKNNPGFAGLNGYLTYSDNLVLREVSNATNLTFTNDITMVWDGISDCTGDVDLLSLTFDIADDTECGEYFVKFNFIEAYTSGLDNVTFATIDGYITVVDYIYGDADGDGIINTKDIILIRRYVAAKNPETGESTVEVYNGADANGDGVINTKDIILVRRYVAAKDPITGESSVILGPAA